MRAMSKKTKGDDGNYESSCRPDSSAAGKKVRAPLVFIHSQYCCFAYCFALSCPGVDQHASSFWIVSQSPLGGEQSTIPHLKERSQGFHLSPKTTIVVSDFVDKMAKRHLY